MNLVDLIDSPLVINLEKDTKRWEDICSHFSQWDILPERFPAVEGIKLPEISLPECMKEHSYTVNLNLSHASALRYRTHKSQKPFCLILEDDCRFLENPTDLIFKIIKNLTSLNFDWSLISLGCFSYDWQAPKPPLAQEQLNVYQLSQPNGWYPWGAHAYLINKKHAKRIIGEFASCIMPPDHILLSEYSKKTGFLLRPSMAYQEEYPSHANNGFSTIVTKSSADISEESKLKILKK